MKRLSIAAVVVAVVSLGVGGWALWRWYDTTATPRTPTATSTTIPLVVVPTQIGKNAIAAAVSLENVHLDFVVVRTLSVTVPEGAVISQSPVQGTEVPEGTVIELTVSSGPP